MKKQLIGLSLVVAMLLMCLIGCANVSTQTSSMQAESNTAVPTDQDKPDDSIPEQNNDVLSTDTITTTDSTDNRTVVDMTGNTISLPNKVDKVFCDWPSGITLVMTLGATNKLVAAHSAFETDTFAWARIICPSIDNVVKDDAPFSNPEAILNYEPDIVITNNKDNIENYSKLGLVVVYVDYNSNESFKESMIIVGDAIGQEEGQKAREYNNYFDANNKLVEDRLKEINEENKPSVYYMDSRFGDVYHTVGTGEIQEEWITKAGGVLATAADFKGRNLEITAEKLLEIDPDIIMIGAQKQAEVYNMLFEDQLLAGMKALTNKTVFRVPQGIFPWCRTGPEAAMQTVWAAKTLYPDRFLDIDMIDFARDFYKEFYGTDVSEDEIGGILMGKLNPSAN